MIPICFAKTADYCTSYCKPTKKYSLALKQALRDTPLDSDTDLLITGVILGILTTPTDPLIGCLGGCITCIAVPSHMISKNSTSDIEPRTLTTGCIRDCVLIGKTG